MKEKDQSFDYFGDDYHERLDRCLLSLGGRDSRYYNRLKTEWLVSLARKYLGRLENLEFLDLGCGAGLTEQTLAGRFRLGIGMDLSAGMLKAASAGQPGGLFIRGDSGQIPFAERSFDLVFSMTLLHHLDETSLARTIQETRRVLRPEGLAVHFDHNPYNPLSREVARTCEFDEDVVLRSRRRIAARLRKQGFQVVDSGYVAFIPARLKFLEPLEKLLRPLPLGGQYFIAANLRR